MKKRLFSILLALCMVLMLLPAMSEAADSLPVGLKYSIFKDEVTIFDYTGSATELAIPATIEGKNVTKIGDSAFKKCTSLTSVTIPDGVTTIGDSAFEGCGGLTSITIPDGVTTIGDGAFEDCSSLKSITIPDSVTTIGKYAFYDCTSLTSITIPDGVTTIGSSAFCGCDGLTSITIPDGVTTIGDHAFSSCGLIGIFVDSANPFYCNDASGVLYNKAKTTLLQAPGAIALYDIPDSVTTIGSSAFSGCDGLTSITIGDSVTTIGNFAFYNCDGLTSITIPDSVTTIGDSAFYYCTSLKSITIPDSVTTIGDSAFYYCTSLTSVTIPVGVTIGGYAFQYCPIKKLIIADGSKMVTSTMVVGGSKLEEVVIPASVTEISDGAFSNCTALTGITIPDSVTTIGASAFNSCISLTSVTIGDSVTRIGNYAFGYCEGLTSITIPASVTTIGGSAFRACTSLTSVTFTGNLPTIGKDCFATTSTTAYYPCNNDTWTDAAVQELAGAHTSVTWKVKHNYVNGTCTECGAPDPDYEPPVFADIPSDSWQYPFAVYAVRNGLMAGKGTDEAGNIKFDPNSPITREEFVQVLYNAEGKPAISIANPFPDVADGGWYKNAVLWAKQNDIASGKGNGNFGVGENISRQDLAMMLYKYAKLKGYSLDATEGLIDQFADGAMVASYATGAMDWAVTNGIMSGKGAAGADLSTFRLDPTGIATRAECAAMLKNFQTAFGG